LIANTYSITAGSEDVNLAKEYRVVSQIVNNGTAIDNASPNDIRTVHEQLSPNRPPRKLPIYDKDGSFNKTEEHARSMGGMAYILVYKQRNPKQQTQQNSNSQTETQPKIMVIM
jgi:hypothetical protein